MKFNALSLLILAGLFGLNGCKSDKLIGNTPPETRLFVNELKLTGENRLQSIVRMHWAGEDKDGIVTAFEISLDNQNWSRVTVTDSLFRFDLNTAADTTDINFFVRAIDDKDARDPSPASLRVPIRNTPPVVKFDTSYVNDSLVLPLKTIGWTASDADGEASIRTIRLKANDGAWLDLPPTVRQVTIIPDNRTAPDAVTTASLYFGTDTRPFNQKLEGVRIGNNTFYLQATDIGTLTSNTDTLGGKNPVRFAVQPSQVLLMDSWVSSPDAGTQTLPILNQVYQNTITAIDLTKKLPTQRNITFDRLFDLYNDIYWVAELNATQLDILESSETTIQNFLNRGGKLFVSMTINDRVDSLSSFFRYTPMERLTKERNGLIDNDKGIVPTTSGGQGYPILKNGLGSLITEINPFIPKEASIPIYEAEIIDGSGQSWKESRVAVAKLLGRDGKTNMIFSSVPIHQLNGNNNLADFFIKVKQEFAR